MSPACFCRGHRVVKQKPRVAKCHFDAAENELSKVELLMGLAMFENVAKCMFTCKIWFRYSRERDRQKFAKFKICKINIQKFWRIIMRLLERLENTRELEKLGDARCATLAGSRRAFAGGKSELE